jgi:hypothetical protein
MGFNVYILNLTKVWVKGAYVWYVADILVNPQAEILYQGSAWLGSTVFVSYPPLPFITDHKEKQLFL